MTLKWKFSWCCTVQYASAMFVMYSDKNRQYTVKAPDGRAVQLRSKGNLHLNRASAHHFHNNNKAAALLTSDQCGEMSHLDTFLLDKTRMRLQDIFPYFCKVQLK